MKNLKAVIETKSNYNGLNGQELEINSFHGTIVNLSYINEIGEKRSFDVSLSEIKKIKEY